VTVLRQFILRDASVAASLYAFLKANWRDMAEQGRYLQITVAEYRTKRSSEQNAFMWKAVLEPIAKQAYVRGERFAADIWNEHLKEQFLPEVNARGMAKWAHLPSGQRRLVMSTTDLNVAEMTTYLDAIQAYAASELGVQFDAHP